MKGLVILFSLLLGFATDIDKIGKVNTLKAEAKKAYLEGDYKTAIAKYQYLKDSLGVYEEEINLNLANAYFKQKDSINSTSLYRSLQRSQSAAIRSVADQQLGVLTNRAGKPEEALDYFKQSLKANPMNEDARYNYEMVKKKLDEKKKQEQQKKDQDKKDNQDKKDDQQKKDDQDKKGDQNKDEKDNKDGKENKDEKKKDQSDKEKKDKEKQNEQKSDEQKEKEQKEKQQPSVSEKLKQMEMTEEKAKMILEAMKNQEVQYLQQNKRKASKPKDRGKPDW